MNIQEIQTEHLTRGQAESSLPEIIHDVQSTNIAEQGKSTFTAKETRREGILASKVVAEQTPSSELKEKGKVVDTLKDLAVQDRTEEDPDWNMKFQKAVAKVTKLFEIGTADQAALLVAANDKSTRTRTYIRNSNEDLYSSRKTKILRSYSKLADLYGNFIDTATWYGKIIISERYLPLHQKTIKPSSELGGIAGGLKYVVHNIIFKFCTDHVGLFESDHNAQKLASHELKGLIHLFNHGTKVGLCCPMMTVIDYKGFRLIAMSRLPIRGVETLVYGSRDAGATILNDSVFIDKLKGICKELGLKPHKVKPTFSGKLAGSAENIFSGSQIAVKLDQSEVITMHTPVDLEGHKGYDGRLYLLDFSRLFPPELPDRKVKCSHLFRLFRPEFVKLYAKKFKPLSPDAFSKFAKGTDSSSEDNAEIERATKYLLEEQIPKCVKELEVFVSIDPFAFVEAFHRNGISLRHLGNARRYLLRNGNSLSSNQIKWSRLFLIEMIARTIKNELGHLMRAHVDNQKVPGDQELKHRVAQYLSVIFGDSPKSTAYWIHTIKDKIVTYFPNALTQDEEKSILFGDSIKGTQSICLLLKRTVTLSGVRLTSDAGERFQNPEQLAFDNPIDETDIEAIVERVKNMSLAAYAKAYTFQMKAVHARNEKEAKRFYQMALQKFKTALAMEPDHIDSLLQIFDAVVFLGYTDVAQSLYNTLISIDPHNFLFLYKYAVFCEKKYYEKAEENYLASLEENPNYILALIGYAKFISEIYGDYDTAERFYQRAMQICTNNCYVLFNYAIFLQEKQQNRQLAKEYFGKALTSPRFESLDEILLLKDYSAYLKEQLNDSPTAERYQTQFTTMKNDWEHKNQSDVAYPNYKANKTEKSSADYGYVM